RPKRAEGAFHHGIEPLDPPCAANPGTTAAVAAGPSPSPGRFGGNHGVSCFCRVSTAVAAGVMAESEQLLHAKRKSSCRAGRGRSSSVGLGGGPVLQGEAGTTSGRREGWPERRCRGEP